MKLFKNFDIAMNVLFAMFFTVVSLISFAGAVFSSKLHPVFPGIIAAIMAAICIREVIAEIKLNK